jgi:hypothetical protein
VKADNTAKRSREFSNGVESMRTMFLSKLHGRVGICMTCGKATCPDKAAGSTLPDEIPTDTLLEVVNDVAEQFGQPRI